MFAPAGPQRLTYAACVTKMDGAVRRIVRLDLQHSNAINELLCGIIILICGH